MGKNGDWCLIRASKIPAETLCTGKICSKLIDWQNENQRSVWPALPGTVIFLSLKLLHLLVSLPYPPPLSSHCLIE